MVTVNESECVGCGACADVCPNEAITVDDIAIIDAGKCVAELASTSAPRPLSPSETQAGFRPPLLFLCFFTTLKYRAYISAFLRYNMVTINESECVGCGACADICPASAITIDEVAVVDQSKCVDCGTCVDECPSSAIQQ